MIAGVGVGGVGRDDVADPTEQAPRADPQTRRDDEPQDARQDAPVVEVPYSGDDHTENRRQCGIRIFTLSSICLSYVRTCAEFPNALNHRSFPARVGLV